MKTINRKLAAIFIIASLGAGAAMAQTGPLPANPAFGHAAPAAAATRTLVIAPTASAVNVEQGDVITFEVDGKTFTWQFDTLRASGRIALAAIAPAGVDTHAVWVYVAPNSLYRN